MLAPRRRHPRPQHLLQTIAPDLERAAALPGMDRYRKSFPARAHLWMLLWHVLSGSPSLRQTHAALASRERLWQGWGLDHWVSRSQLARSSTSRPTTGAEHLFAALVRRAQHHHRSCPAVHLCERVEIMDSTFLRLSPQRSPWSQQGQSAAEVSVQCGLDLAHRLPSYLILHTRAANDCRMLANRDLTPLAGWTLLIDRGYYAHWQFARLRAAGVDFITRRYTPASYEITATRRTPIAPTLAGETITADLVISLGSPRNHTSTIVPHLRLIQYRTAQGKAQEVLTSRHDLGADEVIWLYHQRWRIELFFRFLKRQLGLIRPLGWSREAVWLTVLMVMIVALLLLLVERHRPPDVSRVAWARSIATQLTDQLSTAPG